MTGRVANVFATVLQISAAGINDDTSPDNTSQWDSISTINLVMAIEDEFGVKFSTREIVSMRTVGIVKKVLRSKGIDDA